MPIQRFAHKLFMQTNQSSPMNRFINYYFRLKFEDYKIEDAPSIVHTFNQKFTFCFFKNFQPYSTLIISC